MLVFILYKLIGNDLVHSILNDPNFKQMMKSKEKYDVCVFEIFNIDAVLVSLLCAITNIFMLNISFINSYSQGIAEHFDCVLISYTTFGVLKWPNDMTGK